MLANIVTTLKWCLTRERLFRGTYSSSAKKFDPTVFCQAVIEFIDDIDLVVVRRRC